MNKTKKLLAAGSIALGIGVGALLFSPQAMNASSNVILASVDWVTSQLNPINSKITSLESKINAQQKEIDSLKSQLANGGTPTTPTTPPPATENPPKDEHPSTVYVKSSSATIHSGATRKYKVIATKSSGSSLKVVDSFNSSSGVWYRVEVSPGVLGWIFSGDVTTSNKTGSTVITTDVVNLRSGATTSYKVLETIPNGTTLTYLQSFKNGNGETWYNVETSAGVRGWIHSDYGEVR